MTRSKRDKNEAALIELWRGIGCMVIEMDCMAGFDLLVIYHGEIYIVEVKDGLTKWKLTPRERARCTEITMASGIYSIVTNEQEALELIGAA